MNTSDSKPLTRVYLAARRVALGLVARPRVRRAVMPVVGAVERMRTRGMSVRQRWDRSLGWEVSFWDNWLRTPEAVGRLDPVRKLDEPALVKVVERLGSDHVRIVDVGAGPLTTVGRVLPGKTVEVVATDALAAEYDEALARAGLTPPVRTRFAHAEALTDTVEAGGFDIAYCANALDHMYDPVKAVESMLAAVREGGFVVLNHFANEGEIQAYTGLHQWNIDERGGDFVIWNQSLTENMTTRLAHNATVECVRFRDPRGSRLEVTIQRTGSPPA